MKKLDYIVTEPKDKLLKFLCEKNNSISYSTLNSLLRKKDIKVNGERVCENVDIFRSDKIEVFIPEDKLVKKADAVMIVYEDSNIIVIDKTKNKEVVTDSGFDLLADVNTYLSSTSKSSQLSNKDTNPTNNAKQKTDNSSNISNNEHATAYAVHRLDKNTTGLVIFAKNKTSETELLSAFKNRTIKKFYTCTVNGKFPYKDTTKYAYLSKDSKSSKVQISDYNKAGYDQIITRFLQKKVNTNNTTDLEVELITGKTHQIRAHLAHLGYPIIGDERYGKTAKQPTKNINIMKKSEILQKNSKNINKEENFNLRSSRIVFSFKPESPLYYLNGKQIIATKK